MGEDRRVRRRAGSVRKSLMHPMLPLRSLRVPLRPGQLLDQPVEASALLSLYRSRGLAYATLGEFEAAHADLETARCHGPSDHRPGACMADLA